jgi:uncharacterized protein GlcG (DUF336 family)/uncharacterized protein with PIN domain
MELVLCPESDLWLFLRPRRRREEVVVPYDGNATLGHVIQSVGVPLTEVGPPIVDGARADVARPLHHGAVIELAPPPRPQSLPDGARFLLDVHLGSLARRLRLLGIDTAYGTDADDAGLVERAARERRVLLTQDRGLLMRRALRAGAYVRGHGATAQQADVLDRFAPPLAPWTRCPACNGDVVAVPKDEVLDRLEPGTRRRYEQFARCRSCGRVYWHGAHGRRLDAVVADALRVVGDDGRPRRGPSASSEPRRVPRRASVARPTNRENTMDTLTLADARKVIAAAEAKAEEIGQPMNIAVVDAGSNLVAHVRMDGAWIGSVDISINKAWTSRAFDITTKDLGENSQPGQDFYGIVVSNLGKVMVFAGGIPLTRDGQVVGAIGVSGGTGQQDQTVAEAGAASF